MEKISKQCEIFAPTKQLLGLYITQLINEKKITNKKAYQNLRIPTHKIHNYFNKPTKNIPEELWDLIKYVEGLPNKMQINKNGKKELQQYLACQLEKKGFDRAEACRQTNINPNKIQNYFRRSIKNSPEELWDLIEYVDNLPNQKQIQKNKRNSIKEHLQCALNTKRISRAEACRQMDLEDSRIKNYLIKGATVPLELWDLIEYVEGLSDKTESSSINTRSTKRVVDLEKEDRKNKAEPLKQYLNCLLNKEGLSRAEACRNAKIDYSRTSRYLNGILKQSPEELWDLIKYVEGLSDKTESSSINTRSTKRVVDLERKLQEQTKQRNVNFQNSARKYIFAEAKKLCEMGADISDIPLGTKRLKQYFEREINIQRPNLLEIINYLDTKHSIKREAQFIREKTIAQQQKLHSELINHFQIEIDNERLCKTREKYSQL